jgi:hypothetical protein
MKKFRVRDGEKGEFEVHGFRENEAKTRGFIAKTIIVVGALVIVAAAAYFAVAGKDAELRTVVSSVVPLMTFVLGYYFKSPDG